MTIQYLIKEKPAREETLRIYQCNVITGVAWGVEVVRLPRVA